MSWRIDPNSEVRLFRDMTSPVGAPVGFADDPASDVGEAPEGGSPEESIPVHRPDGTLEDVPASAIQHFTIGKQASMSSTEVHRFQQQNALLLRSLSSRLSLFLRSELMFEQVSLEVTDLGQFSKEIGTDRHMVLFKLHPLEAIGALDIAKPLGLTIADRMLGGKGFAVNPDRTIREVETALIDQVAQIFLREWAKFWNFEEPLRASLLGNESDPTHIPAASMEETFYHIAIDAEMGDCIDQVQMLLPVRGLEPLLRHLAQQTHSGTEDEEDEIYEVEHVKWKPMYDKVKVPLVAQWTDLSILTRELLHLKEGDIIPIDPKRLNQVEVQLAGMTKYTGSLGSLDKKTAVQIRETFKP
ncbi:flagellar motor switch protein FliM [Verrucomicrobia bacterium]|nr:flagellar motor switch protein FliM [Verrucomicrobiota bacterium]MDC0219861.1 flagellar motor switch protein FliM [Verrucomicrobiota bacterium]